MCFPQYNFSMINYDAVANGFQGSMNLFWNQAMMHSSVYPSLFMTPTMNFGAFSPYNMNFNNNWMLDPGFALAQAFNSFGMQSPCPWFNFGGGLSTTTSTAKTDEEIDAEEQRKKLEKIINELKSAEILTDNDKKKIENAKNEAKDAGDDLVGQYEAYKAKFEEIIAEKDSAVTREILRDGANFALEDGKLIDLRRNLGVGNDFKVTGALSVDEMDASTLNSANVFAYVEAFQEQHGNIINNIIGYDVKANDKDNFATKSVAFNKLKTALMGKANSLKSKSLDYTTKENLQDAIDAFEDCRIDYDAENETPIYEPSTSEIEKRFKNLYAMARLIAAIDLDNQIKSKYGEYSDVFNKNLFEEKVLEDLNDDGYDVSDISGITFDEEDDVNLDERTAEEQEILEAEQKKKKENQTKLNNALKPLDAYEKTTVNVTINGEKVSMTKLTPTDHFAGLDSTAKIYYVNLKTGAVTEADENGEYNHSAADIGFDGLSDALSDWNFAGENCLSKYISSDKFKDKVDGDGFNINTAYNNSGDYKLIVSDLEKDKEGSIDLSGKAKAEVDSLINTIARNLREDTPLDDAIIDKAQNRMLAYYSNICSKLKAEDCHSKDVKEDNIEGRQTKESIIYRHMWEDRDYHAKDELKNQSWDYKNDSGITVRYDNDGWNVSWDVYINKNVLIKKFEYFLSEEIARTAKIK